MMEILDIRIHALGLDLYEAIIKTKDDEVSVSGTLASVMTAIMYRLVRLERRAVEH